MTTKKDEIGKWQERLESTFRGPTGIVGERVLHLCQVEELHRCQIIKKTRGFTTLMDSFMDFAAMTVEEASSHGHTLNVCNFAFNCVAVQRLRVGLKLFYDGYYFDAATHLRTVYEISLYLAAVLRGHFGFDELLSPKKPIDYENTPEKEVLGIHLQHRRKVDRQVRQRMLGKESGLSEQDRDAVEQMFNVLHHHIHYGLSSVFVYVKQMLRNSLPPSLFPKLDIERGSIFCNTIVCASWGVLRVLPWLSLPKVYTRQWQERYGVLNDSFDFYIRGWDKPAGPAFVNLMRLQFTFDPVVAEKQVSRTQP